MIYHASSLKTRTVVDDNLWGVRCHDCHQCDQKLHRLSIPHQHEIQLKKLRKKTEPSEILQAVKVDEINNGILGDEKHSCKHFLVYSENKNLIVRVFNYGIVTLSTKTVEEKLDHDFRKLKCVAKVNLAIEFFVGNTEDGKFRLFHAHENNTLLNRSKLLCTGDDMAKLKEIQTIQL